MRWVWQERFDPWIKAIVEHAPGEADAPALFMGAWSQADFDAAAADLVAIVNIHRRLRDGQTVNYKEVPLTLPIVKSLLGLTDAAAVDSNANRVLLRAAILTADVAMRVIPKLGGRAGCSAAKTIQTADGGRVGSGCVVFQWATARTLLDAVLHDEELKPAVRLWYQATIAHLVWQRDFAAAAPHIDYALRLFPDDAFVLFEHAFMHEALASTDVQAAIRGSRSRIATAESNLREAATLLDKATTASPDFIEARVHLGQVLEALGRHQDAVEQLRLAAHVAPDGPLRYFAELFLGRAEQSLGRRDAARDSYTRAAEVYPMAQSPRMGLALLARQAGNRPAAVKSVELALASPAAGKTRSDPWWSYYAWQSQDAEQLLAKLYAGFRGGSGR